MAHKASKRRRALRKMLRVGAYACDDAASAAYLRDLSRFYQRKLATSDVLVDLAAHEGAEEAALVHRYARKAMLLGMSSAKRRLVGGGKSNDTLQRALA